MWIYSAWSARFRLYVSCVCERVDELYASDVALAVVAASAGGSACAHLSNNPLELNHPTALRRLRHL